jgi:hypothetical protein
MTKRKSNAQEGNHARTKDSVQIESSHLLKRRNMLGKLALGGALGATATWQKPVVESIVLPAHAQTSVLSLTDPCILTIEPQGPTTYLVLVGGQIIGIGNAGITVNIEVVRGGQTDNDTAVSNASGAYGPVQFGPYDVCTNPADPIATVTSASFPGSSTCTASHGKKCLE